MKTFKYQVTKTYDHNEGLSVAFRQWRTDTHCKYLHGYALSIKMTFGADTLDGRNWVVGFGEFRKFKELLKKSFDHTTVVALDDPELSTFEELHNKGLIQLITVPHVGCESFAEHIFNMLDNYLKENVSNRENRFQIISIEVREHGANSAIFTNPLLI